MSSTTPTVLSANRGDAPIDILGDYLEPSLDLLRFYRSKLSEVEGERGHYIQRLADVDAQNADVHRLRWELRAREDEIEELQKAVGDAKLFLYDEREQVLKLQAENVDLKSQEIKDRQRIQELLALTEPVAHEITYLRAGVPFPATSALPTNPSGPANARRPSLNRTAARFASKPGAGVPHLHSSSSSSSAPTAAAPSGGDGNDGGSPVWGREGFAVPPPPVPLPPQPHQGDDGSPRSMSEEDADPVGAAQTVASLRRQLESTRRLAEERAQVYARDRVVLREGFERKAAADAVTITQLEKQLQVTQDKLTNLTRDYLQQRHRFSQNEKRFAEDVALLNASNIKLSTDLELLKRETKERVEGVLAAADEGQRSLKVALGTRIDDKDEEIRLCKAQHASEMAAMNREMAMLREKLQFTTKKHDDLALRRAREVEGYQRDIAEMKKALKHLEQQWVSFNGAMAKASAEQDANIAVALMGGANAAAPGNVAGMEAAAAVDEELAEAMLAAGIPLPLPAFPVPSTSVPLSPYAPQSSSSSQRQQQQRRGRSRSGGARKRSGSRGGQGKGYDEQENHQQFVEIIPPVKDYALPAAGVGSALPASSSSMGDEDGQHSFAGSSSASSSQRYRRLKAKGALATDRPVLYRSVKSSGYGPGGKKSVVIAQEVNAQSRLAATALASGSAASSSVGSSSVAMASQRVMESLRGAGAAIGMETGGDEEEWHIQEGEEGEGMGVGMGMGMGSDGFLFPMARQVLYAHPYSSEQQQVNHQEEEGEGEEEEPLQQHGLPLSSTSLSSAGVPIAIQEVPTTTYAAAGVPLESFLSSPSDHRHSHSHSQQQQRSYHYASSSSTTSPESAITGGTGSSSGVGGSGDGGQGSQGNQLSPPSTAGHSHSQGTSPSSAPGEGESHSSDHSSGLSPADARFLAATRRLTGAARRVPNTSSPAVASAYAPPRLSQVSASTGGGTTTASTSGGSGSGNDSSSLGLAETRNQISALRERMRKLDASKTSSSSSSSSSSGASSR